MSRNLARLLNESVWIALDISRGESLRDFVKRLFHRVLRVRALFRGHDQM
jgi:hypothetical protein